jgi:hypothetical protein
MGVPPGQWVIELIEHFVGTFRRPRESGDPAMFNQTLDSRMRGTDGTV